MRVTQSYKNRSNFRFHISQILCRRYIRSHIFVETNKDPFNHRQSHTSLFSCIQPIVVSINEKISYIGTLMISTQGRIYACRSWAAICSKNVLSHFRRRANIKTKNDFSPTRSRGKDLHEKYRNEPILTDEIVR